MSLSSKPVESVATGIIVKMGIFNFALLLTLGILTAGPVRDLESAPASTEQEPDNTALEYPSPDREEIFLPPVKQPLAGNRPPNSGEDVMLMGFADIGEARVILRIDGIITSLRAGESHGDVRVLNIDPPKVALQRAGRQWTKSLVDTP